MWLAARLATYFPVLFVTGVWAWSYYAYIVVLVGTLIDNVFVAAVYGLTFHMLSFLFLAPYYRAVFEPLPLIQSKFVLSHHEFRRLTHGEPCPDLKDRNLPIKMHDGSGRLRLCTKCKIIKPDRCRHCSICGACVLKFDHHCPWVANCVGFHNYKFFFQFLAYATFFLIFVAATSARYFILYVNGSISSDHGIHMAAMCFIAVVFLFSVGSLFAMHIHLLRRNETTVMTRVRSVLL
ncbi:hypothetical protein PTSG_04849 [Salpingoeca rosetta]|uniref:Palmitoyltransferase n=1 Tax=Salpingoeca rosetta (strain ATCC 50818 / BSB-021) TaxID=946362 RepID=F2U9V9_SALR5|nr:uncharacterized protein PTSG_04849 [Salpingoeca rosetta]EGD73136.1 hypothetical protein PTSG_04849 [Salpingoeca rosetta]|eukprot:XP_004994167.1 hypothetical protein PTSG_04849 [Salpingoeca rosetta]